MIEIEAKVLVCDFYFEFFWHTVYSMLHLDLQNGKIAFLSYPLVTIGVTPSLGYWKGPTSGNTTFR